MVAKISVSLEDDLLAELKEAAGDNVSAFVAGAVRRELQRRELGAYLMELEEELGPPSEAEMVAAAAAFDEVQPAGQRRPAGSRRSA
jgi:hypothetical protein